jgi:hypothetical protein
VTYWDGTLATRSDCLKRNVYWAVFPFLYFHPLCNQVRAACRRHFIGSLALAERPPPPPPPPPRPSDHRLYTLPLCLTWPPYVSLRRRERYVGYP